MISFRTIQKICLSVLLLFLFSSNCFAQARRSYNNVPYTAIYYSPYVGDFYYSFGLHIGKYTGDYGSYIGSTSTSQGSPIRYSINVGYQLTNYVSLRFDFNKFAVTDVVDTRADRFPSVARRNPFTAKNTDYSINIIHDLFPKGAIDDGEIRYTPYAILGFGFTTQNLGESKDNRQGLGAIVPIGVGFKYYIFHNLNIAFEARGAVALSDKIDGIQDTHGSDYYVNFGFKATWQKSYKFDYKQYKKKFYHL